MNVQQLLTPFVLVSLLVGQGYSEAYAQQSAPQPAQQPAPQTLNNDAIIKMVKSGLSDELIVGTINTQAGSYDTTVDGIIALKNSGVSDKVISAIDHKTAVAAQPTPASVAATAPVPAPTPAASVVAPDTFLLAEGTDVPLAFDEDLSSKTSAEGDEVTLVLTEDIKVGNVVVAKAGAKAQGEVTNAQKSGMMGKAGELNVRLDYMNVGGVKVKIRGTKGREGESGTTGAIVLTVLFGPIGLIKHGKNIDINKGTPLKAYVSDDIRLPQAQ